MCKIIQQKYNVSILMASINKYIFQNFLDFLNDNSIVFENNDTWNFRYLCYKFNYFIKHIPLPKIKRNNFYEAIFIDFICFIYLIFI